MDNNNNNRRKRDEKEMSMKKKTDIINRKFEENRQTKNRQLQIAMHVYHISFGLISFWVLLRHSNINSNSIIIDSLWTFIVDIE